MCRVLPKAKALPRQGIAEAKRSPEQPGVAKPHTPKINNNNYGT
tara:strand:- start:57989 stop:58120 length:132 start_codon:yes stop_codon:yes gene_type:complete